VHGYPTVKKFENMFTRFETIGVHERDRRQKDRQTNRQTPHDTGRAYV